MNPTFHFLLQHQFAGSCHHLCQYFLIFSMDSFQLGKQVCSGFKIFRNFQKFSRKIDILEGEQITQKGATLTKSLPSNEARQELKKRMKYQIDLYDLAKKRFYELKSSLLKHRRFPIHLDAILDKITLFDSK